MKIIKIKKLLIINKNIRYCKLHKNNNINTKTITKNTSSNTNKKK